MRKSIGRRTSKRGGRRTSKSLRKRTGRRTSRRMSKRSGRRMRGGSLTKTEVIQQYKNYMRETVLIKMYDDRLIKMYDDRLIKMYGNQNINTINTEKDEKKYTVDKNAAVARRENALESLTGWRDHFSEEEVRDIIVEFREINTTQNAVFNTFDTLEDTKKDEFITQFQQTL
jgi:hypothetical protein